MAMIRFDLSMSLDGFIAGPNPSVEDPLGEGGMQLHEWAFALAAWRAPHGKEGGAVNASTAVMQDTLANVGATVMGRNMFGGGSGPWGAEPWDGWWGEDPPFHTPVFVVTHHAREPLHKDGGTTFHFVTGGVGEAVAQATQAAGGRDVSIGGGADVARQCLAAGLVDEFGLTVVPVLLGGGTRLLDGLPGDLNVQQSAAVQAPGVTHLKYRVVR
jgi:dihydrofolate reductase